MVIKKRIEQQIIEKGAYVKADMEKKQWYNFCLRMSSEMSKEIDLALEDTVGISKTGWILQAIQEKLRGSSN